MIKKVLLLSLSVVIGLAAVGVFLYATNARPVVPPLSAIEAANPDKPFVVKLHARWCPACMVTKSVWSQIESAYGTRAKLVVLDFTTQAATDASGREASRLGLDRLFEEFSGATGLVVVLDGRTKEVLSVISGSRNFDDYRAAIDAALKRPARLE